jgi:hypothetical protein
MLRCRISPWGGRISPRRRVLEHDPPHLDGASVVVPAEGSVGPHQVHLAIHEGRGNHQPVFMDLAHLHLDHPRLVPDAEIAHNFVFIWPLTFSKMVQSEIKG